MKILWVKDGKLGHEKQVEALLNEISKDVDTIITENVTKSFILEIIEFLSFGFIQTDKANLKEQNFDLIIGAGNKSFIRMANLAIIYRTTKIVSILCPNYFLRSRFDHICIPVHDNHKKIDSNKKITFEGSLSYVFDIDTKPDVSMIAIGGNNKHFHFDIDSLVNQINHIVYLYPNINWHIFNSRRTPEEMNIQLSKLTKNYKNIYFIDVDDSKSLDLFKKYIKEYLRYLVILFFGLLHGLGFALVLSDIGYRSADLFINLVSFNIGIEVAQISIVLVLYLLIALNFAKNKNYRIIIR